MRLVTACLIDDIRKSDSGYDLIGVFRETWRVSTVPGVVPITVALVVQFEDPGEEATVSLRSDFGLNHDQVINREFADWVADARSTESPPFEPRSPSSESALTSSMSW